MRLAWGPSNVRIWQENVGRMDWSWEGHAITRMRLQGVCSVVLEKVMQNMSREIIWNEGCDWECESFAQIV